MSTKILTGIGLAELIASEIESQEDDWDSTAASFSQKCEEGGELVMQLRQSGISFVKATEILDEKMASDSDGINDAIKQILYICLAHVYSEPVADSEENKEKSIKEFANFLKEISEHIINKHKPT